jgi:hypothetical protein
MDSRLSNILGSLWLQITPQFDQRRLTQSSGERRCPSVARPGALLPTSQSCLGGLFSSIGWAPIGGEAMDAQRSPPDRHQSREAAVLHQEAGVGRFLLARSNATDSCRQQIWSRPLCPRKRPTNVSAPHVAKGQKLPSGSLARSTVLGLMTSSNLVGDWHRKARPLSSISPCG